MPPAHAEAKVAGTAKLLVVLLAFAWGLNWIAAAFGLQEVPPWSLRFAGAVIGAATLFAAALLTGHDLRVPSGERLHVMVAGFFNVVIFNVASAFALLSGATSRAIMISYSMPIWAAVLGRIMLGERLTPVRWLALGLCVAGLGILVLPQIEQGWSPSVFYALSCALGWAFATVYMKWVKAKVPPLANAAWQLLFGAVVIGIGVLAFDRYPRLWPISTDSIFAILYIGLFGVGLAHFLWWAIVGRLPTMTASIGALLVPVIGISASAIFLGERPTVSDIIGFTLIFAAAACVLLQPNVKHTEMPE